jgi:hypothetical protein
MTQTETRYEASKDFWPDLYTDLGISPEAADEADDVLKTVWLNVYRASDAYEAAVRRYEVK